MPWEGRTLRVILVVARPGSRVKEYCQTVPAAVGNGSSARTIPPLKNRIRTTPDRTIADGNRSRAGRPCRRMEFDGSGTFPHAGWYARMFPLDRIDRDRQPRLGRRDGALGERSLVRAECQHRQILHGKSREGSVAAENWL